MGLFSQTLDEPINLLHTDGIANYYGILIAEDLADQYFDHLLLNIEWRNDEAVIFGKHLETRRKVAWYADRPFEYTYSNTTKLALPWTEELLALKTMVEQRTGEGFNSCLLNLYHNGSEGMAWHSDGENDLKKDGAIGSISLGAERKFSFKHKKTKETVSVMLGHGSLLVMQGKTQSNWLHRLPPTKKVTNPRINLTFRSIVSGT